MNFYVSREFRRTGGVGGRYLINNDLLKRHANWTDSACSVPTFERGAVYKKKKKNNVRTHEQNGGQHVFFSRLFGL